ncbi:MAG: group 1 glycosyl transferase [Verrucomicrobia bacterium]|nr:MAG: group 1 glycosyl transferase [Verrucomicrobiota bacterium]
MILLAHPFGNEFVRALLDALDRAGLLAKFVTALGWSNASPLLLGPARLRSQMARRGYDLPHFKIKTQPLREIVRLLANSVGPRRLIEHESGWASIDRVWQDVDKHAAASLRESYERQKIRAVYGYEDCAEQLFKTARDLGVRRVYDLPIAYWETARRLLEKEAERYPDWEPTLLGTRDSPEKLARKTRELDLAELVICPSNFVLDSLPESTREAKPCVVAPFGSPSLDPVDNAERKRGDGALRVLFAGSLTQRKGLADLFAAMKLLDSRNVELVVMGSLLRPLGWYRKEFPHFIYEAPRPHREVLRLMRTCDVLVLPSIVEGRALVQQEAMACGLPLIVTPNAGGDDLIAEGETGFLVPIRSPEAIAEKINWFAMNRGCINGMAIAAQKRASEFTWSGYGGKILAAIRALTGE